MASENDVVLLLLEERVYHVHCLKMPEVLVQSVFICDKLPQRVEDFGAHGNHRERKVVSLAHAGPDFFAPLSLVDVPQDLTDVAEDKNERDRNKQQGKRYSDDDAQSCSEDALAF